MKWIWGLGCLGGAILTTAAETLRLEFSGTIRSVSSDTAGLAEQLGQTVGAPVTAVWEVRLDQPAYVIHYDGQREVLEDLPRPGELGNISIHWFEASWIGGTRLLDPLAEALRPAGGTWERHVGSLDSSGGLRSAQLSGGGVNHTVGILRYDSQGRQLGTPPIGSAGELPWGYAVGDPNPAGWAVGDRMLAYSSAFNVARGFSQWEAEVTLVSMTVVPEPDSWALGLLGVVLVAGCGRPKWRRE